MAFVAPASLIHGGRPVSDDRQGHMSARPWPAVATVVIMAATGSVMAMSKERWVVCVSGLHEGHRV